MHAKKIGTRTLEYYILFLLPNLYYNCADIKEKSHNYSNASLQVTTCSFHCASGEQFLCPIRHYSSLSPVLQLLKHYGTLDKENKYCPFSFFLISSGCRHTCIINIIVSLKYSTMNQLIIT